MYPVQGEAATRRGSYPGDYPPVMGYPGGSIPGVLTFNGYPGGYNPSDPIFIGFSATTPSVAVPFHHEPEPEQQVYYQPEAVQVEGFAIQEGSVIQQPPEDRGMLACAIIGLIFSFIPIVGWINFCVHWHAFPGSKRRVFGIVSGVIGTIFFIIIIIFFMSIISVATR